MALQTHRLAKFKRYLCYHRYLLLNGFILTAILAAISVFDPGIYQFMDRKFYDVIFPAAEKGHSALTPVIVDIDDKSLTRFGQWPWPRHRTAKLLDIIGNAGASAVGIDILFAEEDRTSLKSIMRMYSKEFKTPFALEGIPDPLTDNDRMLARSLSKGPFVLGYKFRMNARSADAACQPKPFQVAFTTGPEENRTWPLYHARSVTCPLAMLAASAKGAGFINATPDSDGSLRRLPLLIRYGEMFYPSLALAALSLAQDFQQAHLQMENGQISTLRIGPHTIPLDPRGNLLLHYRKPSQSFRYFSAADLLDGRADASQLHGRIVFVGTSAAGLEDHWLSPVNPVLPGVEAHATVIDNILSKDFITRPIWIRTLELMALLATGILVTLLATWRRPLWMIAVVLAMALAWWQLALWSIGRHGIYFSPAQPWLCLSICVFYLMVYKFWVADRRVRIRTQALVMAQEFTIHSLASLAETRDEETGSHIHRVQRYVRTLCNALTDHPRFGDFLNENTIDMLYKSAPLHDIGKVGVPDEILRKKGRLTEEEYNEMKKHTTYGLEAIQRAEKHFESGKVSQFLRFAKDFTYTHHERWDGSGYPQGLSGEKIPVAGRLMAIADVYDALVSQRVYKPAFSHEKAVSVITEGKGTFFDPDLIQAFVRVQDQFNRIATELSDYDGKHPEDPDRLIRAVATKS